MKKKGLKLLLMLCMLAFVLPITVYAAPPNSSQTTASLTTGWVQKKYRYYYGKDGKPIRSILKKIGGKRYYFNKYGHMVRNTWKTLSGKRLYFTTDGSAATGLKTISKKTYLFDSSGFRMSQGLKKWNKKTYYLDKNGVIQKGFKTIKSKKYYFNSNGTMKYGWLKNGKTVYYFNSKGIMLTGWQVIKVHGTPYTFYFYPNGKRGYKTWIDGKYVNHLGRYNKSKPPSIASLTKELNNYVSTSCTPGIWSIYVKDLNTGQSLTTSVNLLYSASLIKAFTMGAVYDCINRGVLSESPYINQELFNMITYSSNAAFNTLVRTIGINTTNSFLKKNGYLTTQQGQGFDNAGLDNGSGYNYTTVQDCGKLLEEIYRGKCVSKTFSSKMLSLLKQQTVRHKIPSGVPSGTVYNKTGETDEYEHDIAIVESPKTTYIICVMSCISNPGAAQGNIRTISNMVYNYFN